MRTNASNITLDGDTKAKLDEIYGEVIEAVQKACVSEKMKNTDYSGDPTSGSVEFTRFKNATVNPYGTARTAGKGSGLIDNGKVTLNVDTDKEIVEEIEKKDALLYGVDGVMERRKNNHALRMAADLDKTFFDKLVDEGTEVVGLTTETPIEELLEQVIQSVETTENDWVDGVDRELIDVAVRPSLYGKLRNYIDTVTLPTVDAGEEKVDIFHGVRIFSNHRQSKDIIVAIHGAGGQLVLTDEYDPTRVSFSRAYEVSLFYSRGTKVIMPDLVKCADIEPAPSVTD